MSAANIANTVSAKGGTAPILEVRGLAKTFPVRAGALQRKVGEVRAVDGIDFAVRRGETLGLVGESGCGKTTVGRLILRLIEPTAGSIVFDGTDITKLSGGALKAFRRRAQIVFQDPFASLDPRSTVADAVGEGLRIHGLGSGAEREAKVAKALDMVGLRPESARRYPHEFSGGQRQRIGIARALVLDPELLVLDEPVSALDVSIQAQVLNLLSELQRELGLSYLFIAHNLGVVEHLCDRIAVMYLGRIVETAPAAELFAAPSHPYAQALLSAVPEPDRRDRRDRIILEGDVPSPLSPPTGCSFHPRCREKTAACSATVPSLINLDPAGARRVACLRRGPDAL
jgi:oligopeptide/dipeptide ABC transporter ATP-binding protein